MVLMTKWRCTVCNYRYDEEEGTPFHDLPPGWVCPLCSAPKSAFAPDFAAYARSCGGEGYRCETPEELNEALAEGMGSDKPVIFDVVVDPEKMAPHVTSGG